MTSTTAWISIEVKYHEQRIFSMPQTTTNLTRWRYTVYTINVKKKSSSTEGGSGIFSMTTLDSTVHVLALAPFPFFFFFRWNDVMKSAYLYCATLKSKLTKRFLCVHDKCNWRELLSLPAAQKSHIGIIHIWAKLHIKCHTCHKLQFIQQEKLYYIHTLINSNN